MVSVFVLFVIYYGLKTQSHSDDGHVQATVPCSVHVFGVFAHTCPTSWVLNSICKLRSHWKQWHNSTRYMLFQKWEARRGISGPSQSEWPATKSNYIIAVNVVQNSSDTSFIVWTKTL